MDAKETSIYLSILITVGVIGFIIAIFIISILKHQRKVIALQKKNTNAEVVMQEKERARIASDLHDELGPRIALLKMNINNFLLADESDLKHREKANENVDEIIRRIREITFDLMPTTLLNKGLITALKSYINNINATGLVIHLTSNFQKAPISDFVSINLYRIIQEIIQNTFKHAMASSLFITLNLKNNKLHVITKDDGKGFNFNDNFKDSMGLGLRNIVRRVELMDGTLYIDSQMSEGTFYEFTISIE